MIERDANGVSNLLSTVDTNQILSRKVLAKNLNGLLESIDQFKAKTTEAVRQEIEKYQASQAVSTATARMWLSRKSDGRSQCN